MKIKNVQMPDGSKVDIIIEGSRIIEVRDPFPSEDGIKADGLTVIPGVIDPHVHFRQPGGEHKEDWLLASRAAIKGGVTTVFDMPNTSPALTSLELLKEKRKIVDGQSKIGRRFWFGATPNNMDEISRIRGEPDIIGVKVFMGSSTGDLLVSEVKDLRKIFTACAKNDLICGVHAENESIIRAQYSILGRKPEVFDHNFIRKDEAEVVDIERAIMIAKDTGCKLYICHVSTRRGIELALEAKAASLPVFIEVTPHHVTLNEIGLLGPNNSFFKTNPPLRSRENVEALLGYVCQGLVDTVGSDHAPHTIIEKRAKDYDKIPSGVPGVETLLPIMLNLVSEGRIPMETLVDLTSTNPARIFGLKNKGRIEPGYDADLTLVDMNQEFLVEKGNLITKCGWSPYEGLTFRGVPKAVIVNGIYWAC